MLRRPLAETNRRGLGVWLQGGHSLQRSSSALFATSDRPFSIKNEADGKSEIKTKGSLDDAAYLSDSGLRFNRALSRPGALDARLKGLPTREEQVARLQSNEIFDVLVVGGGATGAGTALDAVTRGLNVACVERGDLSSETSSRSTKLIWAGIRYIATATASLLSRKLLVDPVGAVKDFMGEFKMVMGAHRERRFLLETQPHLTNWMPIAVPMDRWFYWPPPMGHPLFGLCAPLLPFVMKFYDGMSKFTCPPSYPMTRKQAYDKFPQMSQQIKYAQVFYEGQHNDARTNIAIALTAAEKGAAISNYVEVKKIIHENEDGGGRAIGVVCEDKQNPGKEFEVYAKKLVLCAGPFTDGVREMEHGATEPAVKGAAGTHVVLPGYYAPRDMGLLDINTSDGRFLFFLPWLGHTLVGTTDRAGSPVSTPCPPEDEIKWILNEVSKYLSKDVRVRRSDVLSAWQGWRPLASDPHAPPGAPVSRDHIISTNPETGVTFICGGKWTTYREMAEDVVDRVIESGDLDKRHPMERSGPGGNETVPPSPGPCVTGKVKLLGGERYENNLPIKLIQKYSVSHETAEHLAHTYGTRAWDLCEMTKPTGRRWPKFGKALVSGYPYIESEIDYAVKEYVRTVRDFVTLRTRLAYLNKEAAIAVVPRVADKMQRSLGWSEEEKEEQIDEALSYLDQFGGPAPISQKDEQELLTQTYTDLKTLFKSLDVDDSGFLEVGEIKLAAAELGFPFESEAAAAEAFRAIPKENEGRVTRGEFIAWWNSQADDELLKKMHAKFALDVHKLKDARGVMFG